MILTGHHVLLQDSVLPTSMGMPRLLGLKALMRWSVPKGWHVEGGGTLSEPSFLSLTLAPESLTVCCVLAIQGRGHGLHLAGLGAAGAGPGEHVLGHGTGQLPEPLPAE